MNEEKKCLQCGKIFIRRLNCNKQKWEKQKCCSHKCGMKLREFNRPFCIVCGINKPKQAGRKICSRECYYKFHSGLNNNKWKGGKIKKICIFCKKEFECWQYQKDRKCCSQQCSKEYHQTEEYKSKFSNVKKESYIKEYGEIIREYKLIKHLIRSSSYYNEWRMKILKRDNWTCQICKKKVRTIEVDHIDAFIKIILENKINTYDKAIKCEKLWDTENGRTLCHDCHKITDNYGSKALNKLTIL